MRTSNRQAGFTIVELLIVIVVIGVLAAITVVAYNGVQQRTRNTQTQLAMNAYAKAILLYSQDKGSYPLPAFFTCLGDEYTSTTKCDASADLSQTATLFNLIKPYLNNGAQPRPSLTDVNGRRGGFFHNNGTTYYLFFMQEGVSVCPAISGTSRELGDSIVTGGIWCRASFPVTL